MTISHFERFRVTISHFKNSGVTISHFKRFRVTVSHFERFRATGRGFRVPDVERAGQPAGDFIVAMQKRMAGSPAAGHPNNSVDSLLNPAETKGETRKGLLKLFLIAHLFFYRVESF